MTSKANGKYLQCDGRRQYCDVYVYTPIVHSKDAKKSIKIVGFVTDKNVYKYVCTTCSIDGKIFRVDVFYNTTSLKRAALSDVSRDGHFGPLRIIGSQLGLKLSTEKKNIFLEYSAVVVIRTIIRVVQGPFGERDQFYSNIIFHWNKLKKKPILLRYNIIIV